MLRHKRVVGTLDTGQAIDWNEDHHFDPALNVAFSEEWIGPAITDKWDLGQSDAGNLPTISVIGAAGVGHLFMVAQTSAVVGEISSLRHKVLGAAANITSPADLPSFTMSVDVGAPAAVGATHEFGFFENAGVPFAANQDAAFFRITGNVLWGVTGDGAAETATDLGVPSQYGVYRVKFTSVGVEFYVDNLVTPKATHITNKPTTDLSVKFSAIGVAAGAQVLRSDFAGLARLRKK